MTNNFNKYFFYYLFILFVFSTIFLFQKHDVGNDSTISEWIINYSGGFTKRGIIGEICIYLSNILNLNLRDTILIFQIFLIGVYYYLLFNFIKNIKINKIILLSILTPIFILYPVAEIEVLARKEVFIFCIYLIYFFIHKSSFKNIYKIILLSLSVLIWEPVIFFFPFFFAVDIVENNWEKFDKKIITNSFNYFPAILIAIYIAFNPITLENHNILVNYLESNFNEICYMSCSLLLSKSSLYDQFSGNFEYYSPLVLTRYFLIIFFGFGPLIILLKNSNLINKKLFFFKIFKGLLLSMIIILSPVIILFLMGYDWGRWVNISYVFSILFFIYLYKNEKINLDQSFLNHKFLKFLNNKKIFIFVILIFCFGWNPKTVITGDVASKPGFQIPKKAIKIIYLNLK